MIPPAILMTVLHGEQDMQFHQPMVPGMALRIRSSTVGLHSATNGITVHVKLETTTSDSEPVNDQSMVAFFRGADGTEASRGPRLEPEPIATVVQRFDEDQMLRYADASGDRNPAHLDDEFVRSIGLPGIIIPGLCKLAFNSNAIVEQCCDGEHARVAV